jgi:hypothetical protein
LGVGLGANDNTQETITATKPHRRPKLTRVIAPVKQKKKIETILKKIVCEVGIN